MKASILIVDDNVLNLKLAADVLASEGYEVSTALDAEEALEIIRRNSTDLILMDVELPKMDGLALTKKLKDDPLTKHIKIIVLTASAMQGDREKAIAVGCNDYITKPIEIRKLPHQVASVLWPKLDSH
jgi:CheY-like chemotaxis protein